MKIDKDLFYEAYRSQFGRIRSSDKVKQINRIIQFIENDNNVNGVVGGNIKYVAYILATIKHETGDTYKPLREWGRGVGRKYGRKDSHTGKRYYGRGYVQITWDWNYKKLSDELQKAHPMHYAAFGPYFLYYNPDLALQADIAYDILSLGMSQGLFTGKALWKYLAGDKRDYYGARRIVNGLDRASKIANYAVKFEQILKHSIK